MRMGCQTSCSSNKDCHSNDHSVSLTSDPYCYKKDREGLAGMVGRIAGSNAQHLHQLDRQDGGGHHSPLGLLWLVGAGDSGHITGLCQMHSYRCAACSSLCMNEWVYVLYVRPCSCSVTITHLPTAASFNVLEHFRVAVLISPVFLYFWGGRVGAYHMQNSTPAVPKHPQWVQISAPLLLALLLNILLQQKDDSVFFTTLRIKTKCLVEFTITDS